jgi:repressor LexA
MIRGRPDRLTPKQLLFLERLVEYQAREGVPPSVREMQALGGFRSPRSVAQFLDALQQAGYIERAAGARNVRILKRPPGAAPSDRADTVLVPLVGRVAAGQPILAAENVEDYIPVSTSLARGRWNYFILRVQGDSMDRAGIQHGDLVLVRQQDTAEPGDKVVALIDDNATVKRLRVGRDAILLEPLSTNPVHRPIVVGPEFRVQGVVIAAIPKESE